MISAPTRQEFGKRTHYRLLGVTIFKPFKNSIRIPQSQIQRGLSLGLKSPCSTRMPYVVSM